MVIKHYMTTLCQISLSEVIVRNSLPDSSVILYVLLLLSTIKYLIHFMWT